MARPTRKSPDPAKPLVKSPVRIGHLDTAALIGELRQLHEEAEDEHISRMPADDELFGALLYLEAHAGALKSEKARRRAAVTRVRLWEYLREQVDIHQAKAIQDARAAHVEWADLAPALAVKAANAAYNKARRMQALLVEGSQDDRPVRRTPEAVREAERQAAVLAAAERRAQERAAKRHALLAPVAQHLLDVRDGLDDEDDISFWLDQIDAVLPECRTATQLLSLSTYVEALVRQAQNAERSTARSVAKTSEARQALQAAAELVCYASPI
ncbi:hypothetical protein [Streptomyces sp. MN13]